MIRYTEVLGNAVSEMIPDFKTRNSVAKDSLDVYLEHRLTAARKHQEDIQGQDQDEARNRPVESQFPPDLLRRFEVYWKPRSTVKAVGLRSLRASEVIIILYTFFNRDS